MFSLGIRGTMCLTCSLFLPISVSHLVVCSDIDTPLEWFDPWPTFDHFLLCIRMFFSQKSHIHAGFWPKVTYTCRFLAKIHVHTQLFFEHSCTSSLSWLILMWEVVGWVVSVARSSWVLMLSVDCFFRDQRPFFH